MCEVHLRSVCQLSHMPAARLVAESVRHLGRLRELSLFGFRSHDLSALPRHVKSLRIVNPWVPAESEMVGSGPSWQWPAHADGGAEDASEATSSAASFVTASSEAATQSISDGIGSDQGGAEAASSPPPEHPSAHSQQAERCSDPHCPVHSGKRFISISFTDGRAESCVDLSALAAHFEVRCAWVRAPQPPHGPAR